MKTKTDIMRVCPVLPGQEESICSVAIVIVVENDCLHLFSGGELGSVESFWIMSTKFYCFIGFYSSE